MDEGIKAFISPRIRFCFFRIKLKTRLFIPFRNKNEQKRNVTVISWAGNKKTHKNHKILKPRLIIEGGNIFWCPRNAVSNSFPKQDTKANKITKINSWLPRLPKKWL